MVPLATESIMGRAPPNKEVHGSPLTYFILMLRMGGGAPRGAVASSHRGCDTVQTNAFIR